MNSTILLLLLDAGSPFVWATGLHLFIGNFIIGIIEYVFVRKKYIPNIGMVLIVLANYCSMFFGMTFIAPYFAQRITGIGNYFEDYNFKALLIGMIFAFIASIIIEFPFYHFAIHRKVSLPFKKTFFITVMAQLVSYIFIICYYFLVLFL